MVFFSGLSSEAQELLDVLREEKNSIDSERLVCVKFDGAIFNFNVFKSSLDSSSDIYNDKISLKEAKHSQEKMFEQLENPEKYDPKNLEKINSKRETLINAKKLYKNTNNVIKAFENGVFPFKDGLKKKESNMSDKALPDWVKVEEKRFSVIKNEI